MKILSEPPIIALTRRTVDPAVCGLSFLAFVLYFQVPWNSYQGILLVAVVLFSWMVSRTLRPLLSFRASGIHSYIFAVLAGSSVFIFLIYSLFLNTQFSEHVQKYVIMIWLVSLPTLLLAAHGFLHFWLKFRLHKTKIRKCVIVGATEVAYRLSKEISEDPSLLMQFDGFFDSRDKDRLWNGCQGKLLGNMDHVLSYVKENAVQVVFVTLPIRNEERITRLLDELRDTTASIYFVPDISNFDLIQSRIDSIHDIPIVSVLESPINHLNAIWKSAFDFIISLIILIIISPAMFLIALVIKLTSPGPVLFNQIRYGLDGKEIRVYKFRTMNVCENGPTIKQATKNDRRIYPFGGFLRKTSLDELPQFFNVLKGDMSIVGPRPHAVAHNEEYRKLIQGYMLRHKVKPGITGWAQVHGLRGETETLEKMEKRVEYDLEYLKNWSLLLDVLIIIRTFGVVLKTTNAH
ncbi:undecaprenyl-phosphate glucose phosphotransferase [Candidatus Methylomicrobium oryzae]|jgi:putative colanic acid biosynthesis UDP-glucose lipid carrier transferase|uniref:undecaprenyl-phosphate glucose phosphotransferase n=1 Tax=Candidatus Methylomicrobium oryzae TaxID=2802053 RepID=UPI00192360C1|nr:undecaprenyl-phosphate glucose phosphotransferase [Methylomicrobium sp. RS1]MBL1262354.1 undecaprenyl-phosphate glucose phosphotransferase [Methylomicrobium sp. RS1]